MYCNFDTIEKSYGILVETVKEITNDRVKGSVNEYNRVSNTCKLTGYTFE